MPKQIPKIGKCVPFLFTTQVIDLDWPNFPLTKLENVLFFCRPNVINQKHKMCQNFNVKLIGQHVFFFWPTHHMVIQGSTKLKEGWSFWGNCLLSHSWQGSQYQRNRQSVLIQCDQRARLFSNIWPFTSMKTCPLAYKICQSRSKIFPNRK